MNILICKTCHDQGEVFVSKGKVEHNMLTEPDPIYKACPDCSTPEAKIFLLEQAVAGCQSLFVDAAEQCCKAERERDQFKAENEAFAEKYEAARDRKNSITALKIENQQLKDDLVVFKGGISALGEASKKLTFCARTTGGTAGPDKGLMAACDAVEKSMSLVGVSRAIDYIEGLKAEVAGLKTGYEAYEQVVQGLKAENEELLAALKGMSSMYGFCWDLVDGGLICMQSNVQRFEDAHATAQKVIAAMSKENSHG